MQSEAVSVLPEWAQIIFYVASALGIAGIAIHRYMKGGASAEAGKENKIVAGAIFDSVSMKALQDELYNVRIALRHHCDCLNENTDALKKARRPEG